MNYITVSNRAQMELSYVPQNEKPITNFLLPKVLPHKAGQAVQPEFKEDHFLGLAYGHQETLAVTSCPSSIVMIYNVHPLLPLMVCFVCRKLLSS
jgi:hypothetical protein